MFHVPDRMLALAVVPVLAFTMYACGPKPADTTSTTTTTTTTQPAGDTGAPPPPPGDMTPPPPADGGTPAPPPGDTGMGTPPAGGMVSEEIIAFVQELPQTKGKDGKLQMKDGETVTAVEIVEVRNEQAVKQPDGKNRVPAKVKSDTGEMDAAFIVMGDTKGDAVAEAIVVTHTDGDKFYTWSETDMVWIVGPPPPGMMPGGSVDGGPGGPPPGGPGGPPPGDGAGGPPPGGPGGPPPGDAAAPPPGDAGTPATH